MGDMRESREGSASLVRKIMDGLEREYAPTRKQRLARWLSAPIGRLEWALVVLAGVIVAVVLS